jgi:hypothetical protein
MMWSCSRISLGDCTLANRSTNEGPMDKGSGINLPLHATAITG